MNVEDLTSELGKLALVRSKIYNKDSENYAFAFGWFVMDIGRVMGDMNLSAKQVEVLSRRITQLGKLCDAQTH